MSRANENAVVRKPVGATHFKNIYSATERKMLNGCLWFAHEDGIDKDVHRIPVELIRGLTGVGETRNTKWLEQLSENLVGKVVKWNSIGKDRTVEWSHCTALSSGRYRNGHYEFRINAELLTQLKDPKLWGQFRLLAQVNITSKHTLAIYEFLNTEMSLARARAQEIELEVLVNDLREICGIGNQQYPVYKDFNRYVLKPSIKEMNAETDLKVEITPKRAGKKIVAILFKLQKKANYQYPLPGFEVGITKVAALKSLDSDDAQRLIQHLTSRKVSKGQAQRIVQRYPADRIERNVRYCEARMSKSEIKNFPAYIVKSIEQDYQPGPSEADDSEREKILKAAAEREKRIAAEAHESELKSEFEDFRLERTRELFSSRSESWQQKARKEFTDSADNNFLTRDDVAAGNWENRLVQAAFFGRLRSQLLTEPHELSFDAYCRWRKKQMSAA